MEKYDQKHWEIAERIIGILEEARDDDFGPGDAIIVLGKVIGFMAHFRNEDTPLETILDYINQYVRLNAERADKALAQKGENHRGH